MPEGDGASTDVIAFPRLRRLTMPALLALAVLLAWTGALFLRSHYVRPDLAPLFTIAQSAPLLACRRWPIAAWIMTVAAALGGAAIVTPVDPKQPWPWTPAALIAYLCVQFAVAASRPWWVSLTGWGVVVGATVLIGPIGHGLTPSGNLAIIVLLPPIVILGGQIMRVRHHARSRILRQERLSAEERARRQVLEERARIARELHDVVAHHMSVIAVQASTAEYRIDDLPAEVRTEFESIGASARGSLAEMRRLLAVLRGEDAESERSPQPDLSTLDDVVQAARRAGVDVTLAVQDVPAGLPDTVGLSAFRVAQEALSNVIRHAPGAAVRVEVVGGAAHLVVRVDNEPPPGLVPDAVEAIGAGTGHGLIGMRERVALLGGELVAQPRADGGFTVRATLPLP